MLVCVESASVHAVDRVRDECANVLVADPRRGVSLYIYPFSATVRVFERAFRVPRITHALLTCVTAPAPA